MKNSLFSTSTCAFVGLSCIFATITLSANENGPTNNKPIEVKPSETEVNRQNEIFTEEIFNFKRSQDQLERVFDKDYIIFNTPYVKLKAEKEYAFKLNGKSEDHGIVLVMVNVSGTNNGKVFKNDIQLAYGSMPSGYVNGTLKTPATDNGELKARLMFYRVKQQGILKLSSFSFNVAKE